MIERKTFVRVMKGAPLSVFMAMLLHGSASRQDLVTLTGYGRDAVGSALRTLEYYDLVYREHHRKWNLSSGWLQLGLFEGRENRLSANNPQVIHIPDEGRKNRLSEAEGRKNRLSALVSSSDLLTNQEKPEPSKEILDVCQQCGIYGSKQKTIATLPHVIEAGAAYVRDHVQSAPNVRMAIYRIENGWSVENSRRPLRGQVPPEYADVVKR